MTDDLRSRIAKVIWKVFQNTPAIDAADDEWESWWNDSTDADIRLIGEEKALCYAQADAVIHELNLTTPVEYLSVDGKRRNWMVAGHYTMEADQ